MSQFTNLKRDAHNNWDYYDTFFERTKSSGQRYKKIYISRYLNKMKAQATGISMGRAFPVKQAVSAKALMQKCSFRNSAEASISESE